MCVPPLVLFALLLSASCATPPPTLSGFLPDDALLARDPSGPSSRLWWERDGFDWSDYERVLVEPVVVHLAPDAHPLAPEELRALARVADAAVRAELGPEALTDRAGPGVLRVRAAITDAAPVRPLLNALTMLVVFLPLDRGGASIEVELRDGATGLLVAELAETRRAGPLAVWSSLSALGDAEDALHAWARTLARALARGRPDGLPASTRLSERVDDRGIADRSFAR